MHCRQAAVAGAFYPNDPERLRQQVETLLLQADASSLDPERIKALVVPHAGYVYSGPIAASAYSLLTKRRHAIKRVVLLGPSHRVPLRGMAAPTVDAFSTPLGDIPLDRESLEQLADLPSLQFRDDAHAFEHSLEVQLPFLQSVLDDFTLLPLVVGQADAESVARVLERFWEQPDTLIVISSDLSHFHPYATARAVDAATTRRIEQLDFHLGGEEACGCHPLNGLLKLAREKRLAVTTVDQRNSGDTAGSKDQVVGYGSYVICQ